MFIRRLLDTENVQVYLTGSSPKLLSTEIATSLRGRSLAVAIFPLSFQEFIKFHKLFIDRPKTFDATTASGLRKAVRDYFEIGGFPEVRRLEQHLRLEILQGYIDSVLLKDIIERHKVGNITALRHLVDAFVFSKVPIHTRSEKKRLINPAKMYTTDIGLLNAMTFRNSSDYGPLLESMVFMHLRRNGYEIENVNTQDGYETDFFARRKIDGEIQLIQVCWDISNKATFERELRGLKSTMAHSIPDSTIVTWDDEAVGDDAINIVPA